MSESQPFAPILLDYFTENPQKAARTLEEMEESEVAEVFKILPPDLAATTIRHLQTHYAAELLSGNNEDLVKNLVKHLEPDHVGHLFLHLQPEAKEQFIKYLSPKQKKNIQEQLSFPEESVGRIMSTRYLSFTAETSVKSATAKIRKLSKSRIPQSYLYVTSKDSKLLGVLNMRDMLLAEPEKKLEEIMRTELFSLHSFTDTEDAAAELSKRRYFAAPVVDGENHLLGIVRAENIMSEVQEGALADMQKIFGSSGQEKAFSSIGFSLKNRLPWLHVNLLTAFMAASVVAFFEDISAQITILAVFLPVVAGQGGNGGAQSLAIVMRGLVMREIPKNKSLQLMMKESLVGLIGGVVTGLVTAMIAWGWFGNPYLGLVVGMGMIVTMLAAGLAGSAIPLVMKRIGLDPAQCSNIILTTVTDVVGFFAFLGFAALFKDKLM